jgi:hypothetical protein
MSKASLETLPSELLYLILSHLDAYCIVLSFRRVCKRFYQITTGYNQYELLITWRSYSNLKEIVRFLQPENITSLIFDNLWSNSSHMKDFFTLIDTSRLTRLRSITLNGSEYLEHDKHLNRLPLSNLVSLTICSRGNDESNIHAFISKVIAQPNFNQLHLIQSNCTVSQISWTSTSNIKYLTIKSCSLTEYHLLLQRLPHLKTFKTLKFTMNRSMASSPTTSHHRKLMSLSIGNRSLSMVDFEQLLSLTPSLSTLQLMSCRWNKFDSIVNGSEWTRLIQTKLSNLKTFHFFFSYSVKQANDAKDLDLIMDQFRTAFWLREKKWLVTCDCALKEQKINFFTTQRDSWDFGHNSSSVVRSTYFSFTIRFDCTWMDGDFHPNVHLSYIGDDIIKLSVCRKIASTQGIIVGFFLLQRDSQA